MKSKYIIFDLDDTLAYEIDYLKSAYAEIAKFLDKDNSNKLLDRMLYWYNSQENVFEILFNKYSVLTEELLNMYRNHYPDIALINGAEEILKSIKIRGFKIGLITDGRSITQRNKLKALGIEDFFDKIIISEEFGSTKPDVRNYKVFIEEEIEDYFYVADNPKKDFLTPNKLGWKSICLLNKGKNIHPQNFDLSEEYLPKFRINYLEELNNII